MDHFFLPGVLSCSVTQLVTSERSSNCNFHLAGAGYFCVPINLLELRSVIQFVFLENRLTLPELPSRLARQAQSSVPPRAASHSSQQPTKFLVFPVWLVGASACVGSRHCLLWSFSMGSLLTLLNILLIGGPCIISRVFFLYGSLLPCTLSCTRSGSGVSGPSNLFLHLIHHEGNHRAYLFSFPP